MVREPLRSSTIDEVGYDENSQTLEIKFKTPSIYRYFDVPSVVFLELCQAESAGKFFAKNIKEKYRYEKVS